MLKHIIQVYTVILYRNVLISFSAFSMAYGKEHFLNLDAFVNQCKEVHIFVTNNFQYRKNSTTNCKKVKYC